MSKSRRLVAAQAQLHLLQPKLLVGSSAFTYGDGPSGSKKLREALARFINHYFESLLEVDGPQVIVTSGVTTAIEALAWALCDAGDGILLGRPYYGSFPGDFGNRAQ